MFCQTHGVNVTNFQAGDVYVGGGVLFVNRCIMTTVVGRKFRCKDDVLLSVLVVCIILPKGDIV